MADAIIKIGADTTEVVTASKQAAASLTQVATAADKVDRSAAKAANSLGDVRRDVEAASKVLKVVNPQFGELGEKVNGVISALGSGAGKMALIGGAVAGLTAGFVALGAAVVSTASDIDTLAKGMTTANRDALAPQIEALRESRDAMAGLAAETAALQVVLAAEFAPALTTASDALAGLTSIATQAADAVGVGEGFGLTQALRLAAEQASPLGGVLLGVVDVLAAVGASARDAGDDVSEFYAKLAGKTTASGVPLALSRFGVDPEVGVPAGIAAAPDSAPASPARRAVEEAAQIPATIAEAFAGTQVADPIVSAFTDAYDEIRDATIEQEKFLRDTMAEGFATRARLQKEALAKMAEQEAEAQARQAAFGQAVVQDFGSFSVSFLQSVSDGLGALAAENKATARETFEAQKGIAIAQAIVSAALAAVQAVASSGGQPIIAAINVAAIAALTAGQIATIASAKPPSYHRGGILAPDEAQMGPAIVRQNERVAVLTQQGYEALGGDRGLRDVNAGQAPAQAERPMFFVLEDGIRRVRRLAKPMPGYGMAGAR